MVVCGKGPRTKEERKMTSTETQTETPATPVKAVQKLRWKLLAERTAKGVESSAEVGDRVYEVRGADDAWTATVKVGKGKSKVLAEGSYGKCYCAVTAHNKAAQA